MIEDVDHTLERLLREKVPMTAAEYDIAFETPTEAWAARALGNNRIVANLYLYEVRENHDLRDLVPRIEPRNDGTFVKRRAPYRIDLFYLLTTWSPARPPRVGDEHRLLSAMLRTLLRFPTLPRDSLQGALIGQEPPLPTMVAQPDGGLPQPPAEFWSAIGNKLRPALNFVVTIALEPSAYLDTPDLLPPVASAISRIGLDPRGVAVASVRPPLATDHPVGAPVTAARLGPVAGRLATAVFASARQFRAGEGGALRAGEWVLLDDGDDSDFARLGAQPPSGPARVVAVPPLRFAHAAGTPLQRLSVATTAPTTLATPAAAGQRALVVGALGALAAGTLLLLGEREIGRVASADGPARTLNLVRPLRFAHPAGTGLRVVTANAGAPATTLTDPANLPVTAITLAAAPTEPLAQGDTVMIGTGADAEFAVLGPVAAGTTLALTAPLTGDHAIGAAVAALGESELVGEIDRAVPAGATEVEIAGAAPPTGALIGIGASGYGVVTAVSHGPGGVRGAGAMTLVGGLVTDTADPPAPVPGARVRIAALNEETRTDAQGRFGFGVVPHGSWELTVTAPGYAEETKTVHVPAAAADEFRVRLAGA